MNYNLYSTATVCVTRYFRSVHVPVCSTCSELMAACARGGAIRWYINQIFRCSHLKISLPCSDMLPRSKSSKEMFVCISCIVSLLLSHAVSSALGFIAFALKDLWVTRVSTTFCPEYIWRLEPRLLTWYRRGYLNDVPTNLWLIEQNVLTDVFNLRTSRPCYYIKSYHIWQWCKNRLRRSSPINVFVDVVDLLCHVHKPS